MVHRLDSLPHSYLPLFRTVSPRPLLSIPAGSRSSLSPCLLKGSAEQEKGQSPDLQTQWDQSDTVGKKHQRRASGEGSSMLSKPSGHLCGYTGEAEISETILGPGQREQGRDQVLRAGVGCQAGFLEEWLLS